MPALTIDPGAPRSPSPSRPPVSPITPPLPAAADDDALPENPLARPHVYSHAQPDQAGIPPPAAVPISLDANPDAIALRAAISALQVQKMRATNDIRALSSAKHEALERPLEFTQDLVAGRVQTRRGFGGGGDGQGEGGGGRAWQSLPRPQDVVRCPPINWSQYAIVGESLDKLHAEQLAAPTQGTPATVGAGGVYEFRAGESSQEAYKGVASPYSPLRDKIDPKSKGK